MQKNWRSFLLFFSLLFFSQNLLANDLWVKTSLDTLSRHFVSLSTDEGISVKHYVQEKGDYQDLLDSRSFETLAEAQTYIEETFPQYQFTKKLPDWPVDVFASSKKNNNLWVPANQWSDYWEKRYAEWLQSEITADFYMKYNLSTDCADALIGYRWIFARIYSLPVANTVADTGSLFGQFSMRKQWEKLPTSSNWYDDQLFLAALNYVMDMTSTRTIMATDGFPVSVTKGGLQSGTFIVSQTNGSGHIRTITENYFDDPSELPLFTHSSTAPREVRPLYREAFVDQAWPIKGTREILAFRWPIVSRNTWTLTPKQNDPRYSTEQFDVSLQGKYYSFIQFVISRVKPNYDPFSLVRTGVVDLVNYTNMRIKIVRDGYEYCRTHNCKPGTQGYEDWSTPSRDSKYLVKFSEIEDLVKAFDPMYPGLLQHWRDALDGEILDIEGTPLSLAKLRTIFERKLASFDPKDPILRRWGLQ